MTNPILRFIRPFDVENFSPVLATIALFGGMATTLTAPSFGYPVLSTIAFFILGTWVFHDLLHYLTAREEV